MTLVAQLALPAIIAGYGIAYLVSIDGLPLFAAVFPRIAVLLLLACAALVVVGDLRRVLGRKQASEPAQGRTQARAQGEETPPAGEAAGEGVYGPGMRTFMVACLTAGLVLAIPTVGMYTSIAVFLVAAFRCLGMRWLPQLPLLVVGVVVGIYVVFEQLLQLQVPSGTWLP